MKSGLDGIRNITDFDLKGKRVFLRLDLNVPTRDGQITDDTRIQAALPTIRYAMENGARLIIASHKGRPKTKEDFEKMSLEPVAENIASELGIEIQLVEEPGGDGAKGLLPTLRDGQALMLENIRFDPGEEKNAHELASTLSSYTDIYINDAFGASHRAHASIVALPTLVKEKGVGFLMKKEIEMLDKVLYQAESPFVAVLGGAKVSDKIGVIQNLMEKIDVFVIGGAMAYTFLEAQGISTGSSRVEKDKVRLAKDLLGSLEVRNKTVLLPQDHVVVEKLEEGAPHRITETSAIDKGYMGVDIGPKTLSVYRTAVTNGKTVFWNGPMGVFEISPFERGTFGVAEALAGCGGTTIVGGGDSAAALNKSGLSDKVTHISTGGGASLEYLQGDQLPGLEVMKS